MRVLELLHNLNIIKLDVEVLIHTLENALELNIVLELNSDLVVNKGLEKAMRQRGVSSENMCVG
jgi:hypothetical protein